jgi:hypothetical protein
MGSAGVDINTSQQITTMVVLKRDSWSKYLNWREI